MEGFKLMLQKEDGEELLKCIALRLTQLDKAFKSCIKIDQDAADRVTARMGAVKQIKREIEDAMTGLPAQTGEL